jgi:hypothetical protein
MEDRVSSKSSAAGSALIVSQCEERCNFMSDRGVDNSTVRLLNGADWW